MPTPRPTPYTLHPTPYTLHPTPSTLSSVHPAHQLPGLPAGWIWLHPNPNPVHPAHQLPGLPAGWIWQPDPGSGRIFFVDTKTGQVQWEPPLVPDVTSSTEEAVEAATQELRGWLDALRAELATSQSQSELAASCALTSRDVDMAVEAAVAAQIRSAAAMAGLQVS